MYSWHKHSIVNNQLFLEFDSRACLGGCINGIIANELEDALQPSDGPYMGWNLPIADKYNKDGLSYIIDIKPKADEVFLCELDRVFGYSFDGWSPVMLRLKILYNEETKESVDKGRFLYPENPEVIYTMLYLYGSIRDGKLSGTWKMPFGSVTALLFWPEALTYFTQQIQLYDPQFMKSEIKLIQSLR
jgi:hypothetical protein